jgi:hypothetical protein
MFMTQKFLLISLFISLLSPPFLRADEKANGILQKPENIFLSDLTEIKMKIQEPDGSLKERSLLVKKKKEIELKVLIKLMAPTDLKGVGLLSVVEKDGSAKQWFFYPSEKTSRRISDTNKKDRFVDSEFNFADLDFSIYNNYYNSIIETKKEGSLTIAQIESLPKNTSDATYSKIKTWVDTTHNQILKAEYYDDDSSLVKVLTFTLYRKFENIWLAQNITLNNIKKNRITTLEILSAKSKKMTDGEFSISALEER